MSQNKTDILLFLLYIGILITDHHHAYNRRSEITHMNLVTCNGTAKVWSSITSGNGITNIFTCRILETLRIIVPAITQKILSNQFEAEWNVVKINCSGKCIGNILHHFFTSVANHRIYAVGSILRKFSCEE